MNLNRSGSIDGALIQSNLRFNQCAFKNSDRFVVHTAGKLNRTGMFQDTSEDSAICLQYCNGSGFFPTPDTNQCIRVTDLCDGKMNTRNGWDENIGHCTAYCKNSTDWPLKGDWLVLNETTYQCELKTNNVPMSTGAPMIIGEGGGPTVRSLAPTTASTTSISDPLSTTISGQAVTTSRNQLGKKSEQEILSPQAGNNPGDPISIPFIRK